MSADVSTATSRETSPETSPEAGTVTGSDWLLADSLAPVTEGDVLQPLYDGAALGRLVLPFCATCSLPLDLEQQVCDGCGGSDIAWRTVEPAGIVHAATMMHRREPGLVLASAPYPILDVELGSGHRLVMTTAEAESSAPAIGDPVHITFRDLGGVRIPSARPLHPEPTITTSTALSQSEAPA